MAADRSRFKPVFRYIDSSDLVIIEALDELGSLGLGTQDCVWRCPTPCHEIKKIPRSRAPPASHRKSRCPSVTHNERRHSGGETTNQESSVIGSRWSLRPACGAPMPCSKRHGHRLGIVQNPCVGRSSREWEQSTVT